MESNYSENISNINNSGIQLYSQVELKNLEILEARHAQIMRRENIIIFIEKILTSQIFMFLCLSLVLYILYQIGRHSMKNQMIISVQMRQSMENVELTKKQLQKKSIFWNSQKSISLKIFKMLLACCLVSILLHYFKFRLTFFFIELNEEFFFFYIVAGILLLIYAYYKFSVYKLHSLFQQLNEIDNANQELGEDIINKLGPKLTKFLKQQLQVERKKQCTSQICQSKIQILNLELQRNQEIVNLLGKFNWCNYCGYLGMNVSLNGEQQVKTNGETDQNKCTSQCIYKYFQLSQQLGRQFMTKEALINTEKQKLLNLEKKLNLNKK